MDVHRIAALAEIDPLSAPLPAGVEVVTRADNAADERRVRQGSVGKVLRTLPRNDGEDQVEVAVAGAGTLMYLRSQLTPRKVGQVRSASRRAGDWNLLRPNVVLQTRAGSRAWGLAGPESDEDYRGLFAVPSSWLGGLGEIPQDLVSEDGSSSFWEVTKGARHALRADPNALEMLFVPGAQAHDEIGEWILAERDAFVSRQIHETFGRYALGQLRRLEQSLRLHEHRRLLLDWLANANDPTLDEAAAELARQTGTTDLGQARQHLKQLYRSMFDQGTIGANDFTALVESARTCSADLELPRQIRPKNAYNLLRILRTGIDWLNDGHPTFEMQGETLDQLLAIKQGAVPLREVLDSAQWLGEELSDAAKRTQLPRRPDTARVDRLLRRVHRELARRMVEQAPGPFGADAPAPPPLEDA